VKPFNKWKAFETGVIDQDGKILVPDGKRSDKQKESFKYLDLLILNLKKVLAKLPGGGSRFATISAALFLLKEMKEDTNLDTLEENFIQYLVEDDGGIGNTDAGIAGLDGSGPIAPTFAKATIFDVNPNTMMKAKFGKHPRHRYDKYLDEEENSNNIISYAKGNPAEPIVFRNKQNGEMMLFRKALKDRS